MKKRLLLICFLMGVMLVGFASAYRTIVVLSDLFIDFSIVSDFDPYWINDSEIVHEKGRVEVESDGKYILTNAKTYYDIMYRIHKQKLEEVWSRLYDEDFEEEMFEYYQNRPILEGSGINSSQYFNLKDYWKQRKADAFWDK